MADWTSLLPQPQAPTPLIGTNPNALLQMQLNQLRLQEYQKEAQGQNALRQMFGNPANINPQGQFQPTGNAIAQLGQADPNKALEVQNALSTLSERQNRNSLIAAKLGEEEQTRLLTAVSPARDEYEKVLKTTGSAEQAQRAAQEIYTREIDAIKPTLRPETRSMLQPNFDYQRLTANMMANPKIRAGLAEERKEKFEGYTLTKEVGPGGTERQIYVAPGKPALDVAGNPVTPTGRPPPTGAESTLFAGKDDKGNEIRYRYAPGGTVDETGNPVDASKLKGVHKVGTKSEESPEEAAKPTGPEDKHGEDYIKALPASRAALVKGYAEGRVAFPGSFSLRSPYWQKMVADITQYDPSFDAVNYNARAATRKDFTSGKSAQNITSFNTAIGHLGTLEKAAEDLNNTNFPAWNTVANFAISNTGDPRVVRFNTAKQAVSDELTRAFRGTGGNVYDIKGWEENLGAANSPAQLRGAVKQAVDLLRSRIESIGQQYRRGMGTTADVMDLLTPAAKKTLAQLPGGEDLASDPQTKAEPSPSVSRETSRVPLVPEAGGSYTLRPGQEQADFDSLPSGAHFRGPDGKLRTKP